MEDGVAHQIAATTVDATMMRDWAGAEAALARGLSTGDDLNSPQPTWGCESIVPSSGHSAAAKLGVLAIPRGVSG